MKLKPIIEEYVTSIKSIYNKNIVYEVFKNPTRNELNEFNGKQIRYILDSKNKALYIFDANLLHSSVCRKLGISYNAFTTGNPFRVRVFSSGKVVNGKIISAINLSTDPWAKKYFNNELKEDFVTSVKPGKITFEIFKNPTEKEIKELDKYMRVIIDIKNKDIYFFSYKLLHLTASKELKIPYDRFYNKDSDYVFGETERGTKNLFLGTLREREKFDKKLKDKSWIKKYFDKVIH